MAEAGEALAVRAVVIGASAGAVEALSTILPQLPKDFSLPILIVVHLPPDKGSAMAELFASKCFVRVVEAEDKAPLEPGAVYFAPPNYHLLAESDGTMSLSSDEPVLYSRPSIDVLFETAADAFGPALLGILLTGANSDGAKGLRAIEDAGGKVWVQRPDTALATAMPEAAIRVCRDPQILRLDQIALGLTKVGQAAVPR